MRSCLFGVTVFIAAGTGDAELKEKNPEHCALCGEYPCVHIDSYVSEGSKNRNRLEELQKVKQEN